MPTTRCSRWESERAVARERQNLNPRGGNVDRVRGAGVGCCHAFRIPIYNRRRERLPAHRQRVVRSGNNRRINRDRAARGNRATRQAGASGNTSNSPGGCGNPFNISRTGINTKNLERIAGVTWEHLRRSEGSNPRRIAIAAAGVDAVGYGASVSTYVPRNIARYIPSKISCDIAGDVASHIPSET